MGPRTAFEMIFAVIVVLGGCTAASSVPATQPSVRPPPAAISPSHTGPAGPPLPAAPAAVGPSASERAPAAGQPAIPPMVSEPVRECLEAAVGGDAKRQIEQGQRGPTAQEYSSIERCLSTSTPSAQAGPPPSGGPPPGRGPSPASGSGALPPGVVVELPSGSLPGPVRECLEDRIGVQATQDLQARRRAPSAGEAEAVRDCMANQDERGSGIDTFGPQDKRDLASFLPADKEVAFELGPVTITTYDPLTLFNMDQGTHFYFIARNSGPRPVTLRLTSFEEIRKVKPEWTFQLYAFFSLSSGLKVGPGETTTMEFFVSNQTFKLPAGTDRAEAQLPFRFQLVETGAEVTIPLTVVGFRRAPGQDVFLKNVAASVAQPATVSGRISGPDGRPIAGARVNFQLFNEKNILRAATDAQGRYSLTVPGIDDIKMLLGPRPTAYRSIDYFFWVEAKGFALGYRDGIAPRPGEAATVDLALQPLSESVSYTLKGELRTDGPYGYWLIAFAGGGDRVVAVQADHPPQPVVPGHIIAADLTGKELWRVETGLECWGFDVSPNGRFIAAGCYDGFLYVVDQDGRLLHKIQKRKVDIAAFKRGDAVPGDLFSVKFTPDSRYVLAFDHTLPNPAASLLEVETGRVTQTYDTSGLRNSRWSPDGRRLLAGGDRGAIQMFTPEGRILWERWIGEYPLWLEMDAQYNAYAAGKNNKLFAWDSNGSLRWTFRPGQTINTTRRAISADGQFMVLHTFVGQLHALDSTGRVLWQRNIPVVKQGDAQVAPLGVGHSGLALTPDGRWVAVGGWDGTVALFDRSGTVRWSHTSGDPTPARPAEQLYTITGVGAQATAISDDARYIAAGYENSVIRVFQRVP